MERDEPFRTAVRAIVDGDAGALRALLDATPSLVGERASAPHGATLLHYVAANGVEDELQKSPDNAPEIARMLLAAGADPDALMMAYGRPATALEMLVSSFPPFERGVQEELVRALIEGGAHLEGPALDGRPLTTALVFGYTGSAEMLATLGAKKDHLFAAAGLGDIERVRSCFDGEGHLRGDALEGYVSLHLGASHAGSTSAGTSGRTSAVQEALHFAVTHGRSDVAEFLLQRGADVNGRVQGHHCELPLVQALFVSEIDMARRLLERGADPALLDPKRNMTAKQHAEQFGPEAARKLLNVE